jgi:hypothetical protein
MSQTPNPRLRIAPGKLGSRLKLAWRFKTNGPVISSPVVAGNIVYIGSEDKSVYALRLANGTKVWSAPTQDTIEATPRIVGTLSMRIPASRCGSTKQRTKYSARRTRPRPRMAKEPGSSSAATITASTVSMRRPAKSFGHMRPITTSTECPLSPATVLSSAVATGCCTWSVSRQGSGFAPLKSATTSPVPRRSTAPWPTSGIMETPLSVWM